MSPFRLYLFSSLLYFLAATWLGGMYEDGVREHLEFAPVVVLCTIPLYAALLQFVFIGSHFYAAQLVFTLHLVAFGLLVMIPFIPWMYGSELQWRYLRFCSRWACTSSSPSDASTGGARWRRSLVGYR